MTKYRRRSISNARTTSWPWTSPNHVGLETSIQLRSTARQRSNIFKSALLFTLAMLTLFSSGCATQKEVVYVPSPPPQVPQPSAGITSPIQRDFLSRIEDFLSGKLPQPRGMEIYSRPVEPTTKQ